MSLLEKIIFDIKKIKNPIVLNQLFEFLNILYDSDAESNKKELFDMSGKLSNKDAQLISMDINNEFSSIEGDW